MGWDEVKKINSDMKVPLDVYQYLNDYRLWGEDSYVYQDKSKLHKLYETTVVSMNDLELSGEALEHLTTANKHIGKALGSVYGIGRKDTLSTLPAMSAVAASPTAMSAVVASPTAMSAVAASPTAITEIFKSNEYIEKMLTIMGKSKVALNTFKSSESVMIKFNKLSDVLRAKFVDGVEKKNINHEYYTSRHIIQSPTLVCEYTNGVGYTVGGAHTNGNCTITLVGESAQHNISVKNKFITDFDYNSGGLVSNDFSFPQYCKNVSIISA